MKKLALFLCICVRLYSDVDVPEYQILWEDLANIDTPGYQSRLDRAKHIGVTALLGHYQQALFKSEWSNHFGIGGPGFFKILIDDTAIGYTRNGEFYFVEDESGDFSLKLFINNTWYKLADPVVFYIKIIKTAFNTNKPELITVIQAGNAHSAHTHIQTESIYRGGATGYELYGEGTAKQLAVYDVPYQKLRHYKDGIYVLDPSYTAEIKINAGSNVQCGLLEASTVPLIETLSRMYYLTLTNALIPNAAFKANILKTAIEKYANESQSLRAAGGEPFETLNYDEIRHDFIQSIAPFLHYDY